MCTLPSDSGRLILIDKATTHQNREGLKKYEEQGKFAQGQIEKEDQPETSFFREAIDESSRPDSHGSFY